MISASLVLSCLAFFAEDTAVGIWLDRSKFGKHKRSEGPFSSKQHELDGLELVAKNISIEIEWLDNPLNSVMFDTDEIAISIKRMAKQNDALILGVLVEGPAGARQVFVRQQGFSGGAPQQNWPKRIAGARAANGAAGMGFEAKVLSADGGVKAIKENDQLLIAWEEVVELDPAKFERATVWVRYFPNNQDEYAYHDDYLSVAD